MGWFWLFVASIDNVLRPLIVGSDTRMPDVLVLLTTLGGLFMFGAIGLLIGPLIGALLMAAWAVYRRVFEEELAVRMTPEQVAAERAAAAAALGRPTSPLDFPGPPAGNDGETGETSGR